MNYTLKTIEDNERIFILEKIKANKRLATTFKLAIKQGAFPKRWAVDTENDSFLIREPAVFREDSGTKFVFLIKGDYMLLSIDDWSSEVQVQCSKKIKADAYDLIVIALKSAFEVYGRYGRGQEKTIFIPTFRMLDISKGAN